jgi:hypothetical protein
MLIGIALLVSAALSTYAQDVARDETDTMMQNDGAPYTRIKEETRQE